MSSIGKTLRLGRLARGDQAAPRFVMVPMDHGVSIGPVEGVVDPRATTDLVGQGGATCVVVHKGLVRHVAPALRGVGLFVHLSASTDLNPDPNDKRLVGTVEEAVRLGADGISVHVNVGAASESRMVEDMGRVSEACDRYGMPLLAMMYPRGHEIQDPHDLRLVSHVARLGAELGADVVKVPYTGDAGSFREVVAGCPVPVVISGGPRMGSDLDVLTMVHDSVQAGGAGVSMGRNVWQHADPVAMTRAVNEIVLNGATVEDARRHLKG